jgi:predicted ABC-type ATPase
MTPRPRIMIIAGPNGAGKTTFAMEYLPNEAACLNFVNADLIAAGLSPFDPAAAAIQAGRIMLEKIAELAAARADFSFETTLSGKGYARMIKEWRAFGYSVEMAFLKLPEVQMAIQRVATRVRHGGHDIPVDVITRRFAAGWRNFNEVYKSLVDSWTLYDNSGVRPVVVEIGSNP